MLNLIDKLENRLKNTKNENLMKYFFQLTLNEKRIFKYDSNHRNESLNKLYTLEVEIKNHNNLIDSLNSYFASELVEGENMLKCDICNRKFPFIKEKTILFLPEILIILLKRFEYNVETKENVKLNNYFEFPLELSLNNYFDIIEKNNEKIQNNYKYNLFGIVLHEDNTNNGHYWSILKNNGEIWTCFDDKLVYNIDIVKLKQFAFGMDNNNDGDFIFENNRNAYLLFYIKKNNINCENFVNINSINLIKKVYGISKS